MKIAIYPGSFNPWHEGHADVLKQALKMFDLVILAMGKNPSKSDNPKMNNIPDYIAEDKRIGLLEFEGLLVDAIAPYKPTAIIKGLRNSADFEYEKIQQYWNEDLGMKIPTIYIISNRNLTHISSSAIRAIEKIRGKR